MASWFANAAACLRGPHGAVTTQARTAGWSRQTAYDHAQKVHAAIQAEHVVGPTRQQLGRRAGRVLKILDGRCRVLILVGCLDEIFFHGRPVLVGVEPVSLVRFLGDRVADRSGPTWLNLVQAVVCRNLSVDWAAAYRRVAQVLRQTVRASSAVECMNSVLRMHRPASGPMSLPPTERRGGRPTASRHRRIPIGRTLGTKAGRAVCPDHRTKSLSPHVVEGDDRQRRDTAGCRRPSSSETKSTVGLS